MPFSHDYKLSDSKEIFFLCIIDINMQYSDYFRFQGRLNVKSKVLEEEKYGIVNATYSTESISVQTGNLTFDLIKFRNAL